LTKQQSGLYAGDKEHLAMSSPAALATDAVDTRQPRRVRHETRRRRLTVASVENLTPHLVRVTFAGDDLDGFTSLGFDDHIKLLIPRADADPDGEPMADSRDYTPRRFDPKTRTLAIEFALHENGGPATRWAETARVGQTVRIGGPRGSFIIPATFDWHLMVGDETALPAMARRLEELPAGTRTVVLAEVDTAAEELTFQTDANLSVTWVHRNGAAPGSSDILGAALKQLALPSGDFYAWVACESLIAKSLRAQLIVEAGANPKWIRAAGYWRRGAVATHDTFND
jgi:NADPH-dependent ferric siderophore reductase